MLSRANFQPELVCDQAGADSSPAALMENNMEPYTKNRRSSINLDRTLTSWIGSNPPVISSDRGYDAWNDTFSGFRNPNWRAQVRSHVGATTPLSGNKQEVKGDVAGYAYLDYQPNAANPSHTIRMYRGRVYLGLTFAPPTSLTIDEAYNAAKASFYNNARDQFRMLQSGVVIGELRETLRMIRNPAQALRRRIDEYVFLARKRAKGHRAISDPASRRRHVDRAISNTWLEAQFGMRPLMGDVKAGAEALAESVERFKGAYAPAFGSGKDEANLGQEDEILQLPSPTGNSDIRYRCSYRSTARASVRIKGQVAINVDNPLLMRQDLFGVSLNEFIPTVWELIPYSFLVDYFTNIGDVLSAWTFPRKRIAWHNCSSHLLREKVVHGYMLDPNTYKGPPNVVHAWHGDTISFTSTVKRVERWSGTLGWPNPRFRIPGLSLKWLNIAALARSRRLVEFPSKR